MFEKLTNTIDDKDGELFAMLFLLDYQGYVYFDDDNDDDIFLLKNHLNANNIRYTIGQLNRKYITTKNI